MEIVKIILLLKLKWNVEDLGEGTLDYNLKILLSGSIGNVRNSLIHRMNQLHVGTTNYNKQTGGSCFLENKHNSVTDYITNKLLQNV